jgi:hypothetical protein
MVTFHLHLAMISRCQSDIIPDKNAYSKEVIGIFRVMRECKRSISFHGQDICTGMPNG